MARKTETAKRPGWTATIRKGGKNLLRCQARKRDGSQCGQVALKGKKVCQLHGGRGGRKPSAVTLAYRSAEAGLQNMAEERRRLIEQTDVTSLLDEIAYSQAAISKFMDAPEIERGDLPGLVGLFGKVADIKEKLVKIELMKRQLVHMRIIDLILLACRAVAEEHCRPGGLGSLRTGFLRLKEQASHLVEVKRREEEQQLKTRA